MSVSKRLERVAKGYSYKKTPKQVKFKVEYREKCYFFPFTSRKPEKPNIKNTFDGITGVYARMATTSNAKNPPNLFIEMDKAFDNNSSISIDQEHKEEIKNQIINYIKKENDNINVLSPSLFKALQLQENNNNNENFDKGEKDYGCFIYDVLGDGNAPNLFVNEDTNRLLDFIDTLLRYDDKSDNNRSKSECKLPIIKELFTADLQYLRSNVDIFLDKLPLFLHYYFLFYCSQLTIKLNLQFSITKERMNSIEKIYYLLEDERLSAQRLTIVSGYNTITNASKNLFVNLNVLSTLNYIFEENKPEFKLNTYFELEELYNSKDDDTKLEILNTLQDWILILKEVSNFDYNPSDLRDFHSACTVIFNFFKQNKYNAQSSRYSLNIPDLLYWFSKSHGKQGFAMSLTQDDLLFFIRLATHGKRMKIKEVFEELEKRGIFFDSTTQKLVMERLVKLNMLDSVSDSGDAKYVKEI